MTLPEYIEQNLNKPFIWGQHDCVLFAAGWVRIATGKDYLSDIEPWASKLEAYRVLKIVDGLNAIVDKKLQRIESNWAVDGDLALHQNALHLYSGRHICAPGKAGLVFFTRSLAMVSWRCA